MKYLGLTWILLGLFVSAILHANVSNKIVFSHIGIENGLSHSTVFAITQDKQGELWFSTFDGVNRYDGYNFTIYRHQHANSNSISSDISKCIVADAEDRIWIGTAEGLSLYNRHKDNFRNYYYQKNGVNIAVDNIVPIKDDWLMLGTINGILLFDVVHECFVDDSLSIDMKKLKPTSLSLQDDNVFIAAQGGIYTYSVSSGVCSKILSLPVDVKVHSVLCQMFSRMWFATEGYGLYCYDLHNHQLKCYRYNDGVSGLNSDYVRSLALDAENRLWIGTYGGLNIYKEGIDRFYSVKSSDTDENSLSQNSVRSIFKDAQGGMWLGTYWGGLNYYHPLCNRFQRIRHIPYVNSLSNNVVNCIEEDENRNLWIGTSDGGLNYYHSDSDTYEHYAFHIPSSEAILKDIKAVYVDRLNGNVYIGAHAGGMLVLNKRTGQETHYSKQNSNIQSNNIYSIVPDGHVGLWVASLEQLMHFSYHTQSFSVVTEDADGNDLRLYSRILYKDSKNRLWVGGKRGFVVLKQIGKSLFIDSNFKIPECLSQSFINCFYESVNGDMWLGTRNGLYRIASDGSFNVRYTVGEGLPSNVIFGILEDTYGRLWLSTNCGLSCLTPKTSKVRNFTVLDGLQCNQFNSEACCQKSDGSMWFGGINGITVFRPETLVDNPYTPQPVIKHLFVYNKEVTPNDNTGILNEVIGCTDHITLSSSQNSFALSFVVSNYIAGQHNTFSYKLDGYDKKWYKQSGITPIVYSNLPAGTYTFYVKAANNDGLWNENPTSLRICILPVWYKTWWAILLFVVFIGLLIGIIIRFFWFRKCMRNEIRMERIDKKRQEEISQMRIRFYVNISHELRTPLTLIVAPLQELLGRINTLWERERLLYIHRNTNKLLHIVNQLMDYRRAELGIFELHAVYANAYQRVLSCFENYESLAKRKNIDYNFYTDLQERSFLFDENYLDLSRCS